MTLKELAKKYKDELKRHPYEQTIKNIINEINSIVYEDTNEKISKADKDKLLDLIKNDYADDGSIILKHSDNSMFLKAVNILQANLEDGGDE